MCINEDFLKVGIYKQTSCGLSTTYITHFTVCMTVDRYTVLQKILNAGALTTVIHEKETLHFFHN